jgi:methylmalonyl-CoA mutase N-terminal domain/subunit
VTATGDERRTDSGIEVKPVYTAEDAPEELELPGESPFTRGPYPDMYRGRPWTIRQYAGFASAEETNQRFRYLLERGQTGLSVAFDLPTQLGYDSDDPRAVGEVGRTGVAIDSIADMELLFDQIPLAGVSTSMTINAPAALLLLLYELVAEEQGVRGDQLRGTVQNDILKEYIARGNYIFPPRPSMRITTDLFAYTAERIPRWNPISISGYHIREAGSTAVQELAFTLANGIAYAEAAVVAGLSPDELGERLSFFFNAHNHFFQEVAKFRAARRSEPLHSNSSTLRLGGMRSIARVKAASCGASKFSGMKTGSGPRVERYSSSAPSASTKKPTASSRSGTVNAT